MKTLLDQLIQKAHAADWPDFCDDTSPEYFNCCSSKATKLTTLEQWLEIAEQSGDKNKVSDLKQQIADFDKNFRNECGTYATNSIEATDADSCKNQYWEFFVEVGEGSFADICYCDDKATDESERIDCREISVASLEEDCAARDGIYKAWRCEVCAFGLTTEGDCVANTEWTLWIECGDPTKPCSLNTAALFGTAGVSGQTQSKTLLVWFQDVTLAATGFIGTVLTISFIFVALRYITGGVDQSYVGNAKKAFRYWIIGFFLVAFSYTIVRLVQFLATGW